MRISSLLFLLMVTACKDSGKQSSDTDDPDDVPPTPTGCELLLDASGWEAFADLRITDPDPVVVTLTIDGINFYSRSHNCEPMVNGMWREEFEVDSGALSNLRTGQIPNTNPPEYFPMDSTDALTDIRSGMNAWELSGVELDFTDVPGTRGASNDTYSVVTAEDGPSLSNDVAGAEHVHHVVNSTDLTSDIVFYKDVVSGGQNYTVRWGTGSDITKDANLANVAKHEFGHAAGLDHNSYEQNSVMRDGQTTGVDYQITDADEVSVLFLYTTTP